MLKYKIKLFYNYLAIGRYLNLGQPPTKKCFTLTNILLFIISHRSFATLKAFRGSQANQDTVQHS